MVPALGALNRTYYVKEDRNDVYSEAKRRIGSTYTKSGDILKGLTIAEQKKWLPEILGIASTEAGWAKQVRDYFANLTVEVPPNGVELNISTDEEGNPINVVDYIKWKFASAHPHVAAEEKSSKGRYFISDPQREEAAKIAKGRTKKDAFRALILVTEDLDKSKQVLKAFGIRVDNLSAAQIELALEDQAEANPTEFVRVCNDKNLEMVAFIWDAIESGVLRKSGNTFLFGDEVLGDDMEQAIRFLNTKKNSEILLDIKAKVKAFS
jgi:hypothetical protein